MTDMGNTICPTHLVGPAFAAFHVSHNFFKIIWPAGLYHELYHQKLSVKTVHSPLNIVQLITALEFVHSNINGL
jgi:hypothetical protein